MVILQVSVAVEIDNIRSAISWAFSSKGEGPLAVALVAASAQIWFQMSLLNECRELTEKALDRLESMDRGTRREMVLQTLLGLSLMYTRGSTTRAREVLTRAIELAEGAQDLDHQMRALTGLAFLSVRIEDFRGALVLARRAEAIMCVSLFCLGEYPGARTYSLRAPERIDPLQRGAQIARYGMDYSILSRCIGTQILWTQGRLDQSAQAAREVLADAEAGGHPTSLCQALAWCGCRIPLRAGDFDTAERSIGQLKHVAETNGLSSYYASALGYEGQVSTKRGDIAAGARLLRNCLDRLRATQYENIYTSFLSSLAEVLTMTGDVGEGLAAADEAVRRSEHNAALWWMPEALRIKGEALIVSDRAEGVVDLFHQSLDLARHQGALYWELRTAISLGRLLRAWGHLDEARQQLHAVYVRFTEGFGTADLQTAKRLLEEWK